MDTMHTNHSRPARAGHVAATLVALAGFATVSSGARADEPIALTERVSVPLQGLGLDESVSDAEVSGNGRFVAFSTASGGLVEGDAGRRDVFVRDVRRGVTHLVSVGIDGQAPDDDSHGASISRNGRWIAFVSGATNLVEGDDNGKTDAFLHDRRTGRTVRCSAGAGGADARGGVTRAAVSANGRHVMYLTHSADRAEGGPGLFSGAFVFDRRTGATERVSVSSQGGHVKGVILDIAISGNGRVVAFSTLANNLNGSEGDTNGAIDVYVLDRRSGITRRVSQSTDGEEGTGASGEPSLSKSGRWVSFSSIAPNLDADDDNPGVDVFVHDLRTGTTRLVSRRDDGGTVSGNSSNSRISGNGRHVVFSSSATNLTDDEAGPGHQVFVRDLRKGVTRLVSFGANAAPADDESYDPTVSHNGRAIAWISTATNLIDEAVENGYEDAWVQTTRRRR